MFKKIASQFQLLGNKLVISTKRFPGTLLLAIATVIILIYNNHLNYSHMDLGKNLTRTAMVLALGIPLTLCIKVFIERKQRLGVVAQLALYVGAIIYLILYYLFMLKYVDKVSTSRYIGFTISLYLTFSFIPYFFKRKNYEFYVITLFNRFVTTYLYSAILFLGLAAITATINILFTINISNTVYLDLWLIVIGIFAPAFFLADIPEYGQKLNTKDYSKVLKVLLLYIVMPLVVAYSLILYAYFIKILVVAQWPEGILANLVLWFSILSTIAIFFIYPLRNENQWVKIFISFFPKLIVPLLFMMFVSLGIRINAYGITENRYYVLIAGLWVMGFMIYFILNKNPKNIVMIISLAIICIMAVIGPWSSYSVSKFSQNRRFENILKTNNMISNENTINSSLNISKTDREEISSILLYFQDKHSFSDLKYVPKNFEINQTKDIFGFEIEGNYWNIPKGEYFSHTAILKGDFLNIKEYSYFVDYTRYMSKDIVLKNDMQSISVYYSKESRTVEIKDNGKIIYTQNIDDIAKIVHENNIGKHEVSLNELSYSDSSEYIEVLYVFNDITGVENSDCQITIYPPMFYIFVKVR